MCGSLFTIVVDASKLEYGDPFCISGSGYEISTRTFTFQLKVLYLTFKKTHTFINFEYAFKS